MIPQVIYLIVDYYFTSSLRRAKLDFEGEENRKPINHV